MQARMQDVCSYLVMSEYLKPSLTLHALSGWPSLYLHMSTKLNPKKWPPGLRGLSHQTFAHCDCNCDCDGHKPPNSPCRPCPSGPVRARTRHPNPFNFLVPCTLLLSFKPSMPSRVANFILTLQALSGCPSLNSHMSMSRTSPRAVARAGTRRWVLQENPRRKALWDTANNDK